MANPICLSPLKFYDDYTKQNHRKFYAFGHISPLIVQFNNIPPFQLVVPFSNVSQVYLYDAKTDKQFITTNLASRFVEMGLKVIEIEGYKVLQFPGTFPLIDIKFEGEYYLLIVGDDGSKYYSEVFCCSTNTSGCIEIEYWNPEADFELKNGIITFANNFHFKIWLNSELGKPDYSFDEEATERLGYNFIESQVSKKTYKFTAVVPEYICDAMRVIRLCSNKKLKSMGELYDMLTFEMSVEWQDQGDLAAVTCEFEVDNVIVNLGGFKYEEPGGDYSNDYNNDYKTE